MTTSTSITRPNPAVVPSEIPPIVRRFDPLVHRLLKLGMPMGPNILMTVRGRKSGQPRTAPVALLEVDGRTFLFSPFGEVSWVHNIRAAGRASFRHGRRRFEATATELTPEAAAPFLEAGLRSFVKLPVFGSMVASWYGVDGSSTTGDFQESARHHPAFELHEIA